MSEYRIFVAGSGGISGTVSVSPYLKRISYPSSSSVSQTDPSNYYFSDVPDKSVMKYCDEALKEIESIIVEAEQTFSVKL